MSETLKPCPFCGSRAEWCSIDEHRDRIQCSNDECPVMPHTISVVDTRGLVVAWNTRPQHLALVDVLKAVVDCLDPNKDDGYRAEDPGGAMDTAFAQARKVLHEAGEQ